MNKPKRYLTIILLAVFILIKVHPSYYRLQFLPRYTRTNPKITTRTNTAYHNAYYLVKVEKSIINRIDPSLVPTIKFSGTPFELFFSETVVNSLNSNNYFSYFPSISFHDPVAESYLFQRVLRL